MPSAPAPSRDLPLPAARVAAGIALGTAVLAVAFRFLRARAGVDWVVDDAYYYAEIARRLRVPLGTVMSRISRGRRMLHESLLASDQPGLGPQVRR